MFWTLATNSFKYKIKAPRNSIFASALLIFLFFLVSCFKEYPKDTLVLDILVTDSITGAPIPGSKIGVCYDLWSIGQTQYDGQYLGVTDTNGKFYIEWESPRQNSGHFLQVFPKGNYPTSWDQAGEQLSCDYKEEGIFVPLVELNTLHFKFEP